VVTYTYTKAGVEASQLAVELVASGITTPLDYINISSDTSDVDLFFQATLSGTEESLLSTLVTNHVAGTCDQHVKLHKYIAEHEDHTIYDSPTMHNYITGTTLKFFPKRTMIKGEVTRVDYFADEALTDLILRVDIEYTRDALYLALERTVTRTWFREDDTPAPTQKVTKKIYTINIDDQMKEAHRRRQNIIDHLLLVVLGMMVATLPGEEMADILTDGRSFNHDLQGEFDTYVAVGGEEIVTVVSGTTVSGITGNWIDNVIDGEGTTIRDYMMEELS